MENHLYNEKTEIVICCVCSGHGSTSVYCGDHHKSNYRDETCKKCNGKGRVLKTIKVYIQALPEN